MSDFLKELREKQRSAGDDETASSKKVRADVTFIDLFESYGGFVHLEGLEMLSAGSSLEKNDCHYFNMLV